MKTALNKELSTLPIWLLWGLGLSVGWLIPNASFPWLSFDRELITAAVALLFALVLAMKFKGRWALPLVALIPLALAAVPIMQWAGGLLYFGGDAWMCSLYLTGFALAIVVGARAESLHPKDWMDWMFFSLGLAALASVGIALYQWFQLDYLDVWINDLVPGGRPYGNLSQANLLATLLAWGLVSVWWAYLTLRTKGAVAIAAALFLLCGLAMTYSRTAWIFVGLGIPAVAVIYRRPLETKRYWKILLILWLCFIALVLGWAWLSSSAQALSPPSQSAGRLSAGTRLYHWREMLIAIAQRPLFGWGWGQVSVAQGAVTAQMPLADLPELIHYSHDLVLDLLVWNGIPIGLTVMGLFSVWLIRVARQTNTAKEALLLMAIAILLVHCLLEYPHAYSLFLLPLGFFMGSLSTSLPTKASIIMLPRSVAITVYMCFAALLAWTAVDYSIAKASYEQLRFEAARVGPGRNSKPPELQLLTQLQAWLTVDRMKPSGNVSDDQLKLMRKTAEHYPAESVLFRYAIAEAGAGHVSQAMDALTRLCHLYPKEQCGQARRAWEDEAQTRFPFLKKVPFPEL